MQSFFKNDTAEVYYDDGLDALFLRYLDRVKSTAAFIDINSEVLKAFKKLNTQKFVADIREMGIISLDAQQWVVNILIPGMFEHLKGRQLYHAQLIDVTEVMSKVSGANIKTRASDESTGFKVLQFSEEGELVKYLKRVS